MSRFTLEKSVTVYDSETNTSLVVSEDPDGLGLIQLEQEGQRILFPLDALDTLREALSEVAENIRENTPEEPEDA